MVSQRNSSRKPGGLKADLIAGLVDVRVDKDYGLATIELCHQFFKSRVTQEVAVGASQQHHAISLQLVERANGLLARRFGKRRGEHCKIAEPARVIMRHLSREIVTAPGQVSRLLDPSAEMHAGSGQ